MSSKVWDDGIKKAVKNYRTMFHMSEGVEDRLLDSGLKVKDLVAHLLEKAAEKEMNAGFSGRPDDGGARHMARAIAAWVAGMSGEVPREFEKLHAQCFEQTDPEYQEYLRLQKKFE